jgi:hypothetical protein
VTDRFSSAAVVFLILGATPLAVLGGSANGWTGRATPHFAIYTTDRHDEGAQDILGHLEAARLFFEQTGWATKDANKPLNIVAFGSSKEYESYGLNPSAYAFYQRTREGDYVVMRDLEPEHYGVVVHEYTHFVVEHSGLSLPLWLNEGLADLYSTVECRKSQVFVGNAPEGRMATLNFRRWMDWGTLLTVDHDSAYYQQTDKMLLFYAQSWALTHMLAMDPAYASQFPNFLKAVSKGAKTEAAMLAVYHKTLNQVGRELEEYVGSKRMAARMVDIDARCGRLLTEDIADAGKRVEFALSDVLAANPQMASAAKGRLETLTAKYPDDPHSEESLGFLAMRAGLQKDAEQHFARAVEAHSQDPEVWFRLAHLKLRESGPSEEVMALLERVVAADGGHYNARLELGFAAAKSSRFDVAVNALEGMGEPQAQHAYVVSYTLAYCLVELHQGNRARTYAERARNIAANNTDREQVAGLLRYIEQEAPLEVASR